MLGQERRRSRRAPAGPAGDELPGTSRLGPVQVVGEVSRRAAPGRPARPSASLVPGRIRQSSSTDARAGITLRVGDADSSVGAIVVPPERGQRVGRGPGAAGRPGRAPWPGLRWTSPEQHARGCARPAGTDRQGRAGPCRRGAAARPSRGTALSPTSASRRVRPRRPRSPGPGRSPSRRPRHGEHGAPVGERRAAPRRPRSPRVGPDVGAVPPAASASRRPPVPSSSSATGEQPEVAPRPEAGASQLGHRHRPGPRPRSSCRSRPGRRGSRPRRRRPPRTAGGSSPGRRPAPRRCARRTPATGAPAGARDPRDQVGPARLPGHQLAVHAGAGPGSRRGTSAAGVSLPVGRPTGRCWCRSGSVGRVDLERPPRAGRRTGEPASTRPSRSSTQA